MKPIETQYKGYRFRSRLEARWAVFFDALGIEWEYEPEGFELDDGTRYLPDFLLHRAWCGESVFVEVKAGPGSKERDWEKAKKLSAHKPILLLAGAPRENRTDVLCEPDVAKDFQEGAYYWDVPVRHISFDVHFHAPDSGAAHLRGCANTSCGAGMCDLHYSNAGIRYAAEAARSARFEHGECGAA